MDIHFHAMGGRHHTFERPGSDIKKTGYLKKLKTMKKKFFVLRSTSSSGPARFEYFDSEKKFQAGNLAKRSIHLHRCFNINKSADSRSCRYGIVLYTVQDSFTVLADSEEEQEAWLGVMLEYQNEYLPDGDIKQEHYEHLWQVTIQPRGLGQGKGIKGRYRLCLNSSEVSLFRVNSNQPQFTIQLVTIRSVAHNENSFWMEVGNYAATGPGELWFAVEDASIAQGMHTTILQYMTSVKDVFHKDQQFGHLFPKREIHPSHHDSFGGQSLLHSDSRKSFANRSMYSDDGSQDYIMSFPDDYKECSSSVYPGDLDGEISSYLDSDFPSMMQHHGSHGHSMHAHNFSELLHPTHLPTVKEGGSGEGYLLTDNPSLSESTELPRPEPAACLLSDDHSDLPPRTYSLGSRPAKKLASYSEMTSRKVGGNEISRATSAPHIPKGRRERDQTTESPTPSASPLSMSLKSDDSDSFVDCYPMRPRTASDSFNYRSRTSSFGKIQQPFRPRSSSYGQGKRPVINSTRLLAEKTRIPQDQFQRISRESSMEGSFESLRVSSENLRKTTQELRQQVALFTRDQSSVRSTPSPQMTNTKLDHDVVTDTYGSVGPRKFSFSRIDSSNICRPSDVSACVSGQYHRSQSQHTSEHAKVNSANSAYVNVDYNNTAHSLNSDMKSSLPASSHARSAHQAEQRYMNIDFDNKHKKSDSCRSVSMENVDTYFISELHLGGNKSRTGSVGSKDKKVVHPGSNRKSSITAITTTSSELKPQQPQPLATSSSRSFGSSDSIRKPTRQSSIEKPVAHGKDFRKKSGSTGSRPQSTKTFFSMGFGKDESATGTANMPLKKLSSGRLSVDDCSGEYIEVAFDGHIDNSYHPQGNAIQFNSAHSAVTAASQSTSSSDYVNFIHSSSAPSSDKEYVMYSPAPASSRTSYTLHQELLDDTCYHCLPRPTFHNHPPSSSVSSCHAIHMCTEDGPRCAGPAVVPCLILTSSVNNNLPPTQAADKGVKNENKVVQTSNVDFDEYVDYNPHANTFHTENCLPVSPSSAFSRISSHMANGSGGQHQLIHKNICCNCLSKEGDVHPGVSCSHFPPSSSSVPHQNHVSATAGSSGQGNKFSHHNHFQSIKSKASDTLHISDHQQMDSLSISSGSLSSGSVAGAQERKVYKGSKVSSSSSTNSLAGSSDGETAAIVKSKNIPSRPRSRHSLGDIMSVVSSAKRESLACRLWNDASRLNPKYGDSQCSGKSRGRRSLSDIFFGQRIVSPGLISVNSESDLPNGSNSSVDISNSLVMDHSCNPQNVSGQEDADVYKKNSLKSHTEKKEEDKDSAGEGAVETGDMADVHKKNPRTENKEENKDKAGDCSFSKS